LIAVARTGRLSEAIHRFRDAESGVPAAVATLLSGTILGGIGFLGYAIRAASDNNEAMLRVAERQGSGQLGGADVTTASSVALTAFAPLGFAFGTPLGWLTTYLMVSGLVRCVAAAAGERQGDPLLGFARRAVLRTKAAHRESRDAAERLRLEGEEVADRLVPGERVGIEQAVFVVVASRRKPDWTPGTVLACGDDYYLLLDAVERQLPTGLRTLYPLAEVAEAGVLRRVVPYTLPQLSEVRPAEP